MLHGLKKHLFYFNADTGGGGSATGTTESETSQAMDVEVVKAQALSDLLGTLGVASIDEAKTNLSAWNEYQDGQKTELQKVQDSLTVANNTLAERDGTIANLQAKLTAAQLGVPADNTEDVVTLAKGLVSEQVDITQAIATVLDKYPHFKGGGSDAADKPSFVTETHSSKETTEDAFLQALGLTK